ncbi:AbrB/MazE/SpoVT family DNA-binding domain-containing protein [Halarchaeum salinum]|uniref:AbrB/MazE/SpoVT family DNA-binding domain-containing protein n=1 Tax=Halarchaeum salinum TaxID=489912 RepID=A0AAV3S783_9EURY
MSRTGSRQHGAAEDVLGEKVHSDTKTRQAQANGNSTNSIEVNITQFAATFHGIEKGELLEIEVREHGILIRPFTFGGEDDA